MKFRENLSNRNMLKFVKFDDRSIYRIATQEMQNWGLC